MGRPRFRQLPHTADLRLAAWGESEEELTRNAIAGALNAILPSLPPLPPDTWEEVEQWPSDPGERLVRAVNEALFWLFARRRVAVDFRTGDGARLGLVPLPESRSPSMEIKAATFHDLQTSRRDARRRAIITLDV